MKKPPPSLAWTGAARDDLCPNASVAAHRLSLTARRLNLTALCGKNRIEKYRRRAVVVIKVRAGRATELPARTKLINGLLDFSILLKASRHLLTRWIES